MILALSFLFPHAAPKTPLSQKLHAVHEDRQLRQKIAKLHVKEVTLEVYKHGSEVSRLTLGPNGLSSTTSGQRFHLNYNPVQLMTMWVGVVDSRLDATERGGRVRGNAIDRAATQYPRLTPELVDWRIAEHLARYGAAK